MESKSLILRTHHHTLTFCLYEEPFMDRSSYSIAIIDQNKQFAYANDISENLQNAQRFLELICQGGLDPRHLYDVLEDFLPLT